MEPERIVRAALAPVVLLAGSGLAALGLRWPLPAAGPALVGAAAVLWITTVRRTRARTRGGRDSS